MTIKLIRYDAACRALAAAHRVDEVKDIRDKALAMQHYAKQAKDRTLIEQATEIRVRAERRVGELLIEMEKRKERQLKGGNRKSKSHDATLIQPPKLSDLGLTKTQSSRYQRLAKMRQKEFEEKLKKAKRKAVSAVDGTSKLERVELQRKDEERVAALRARDGRFRTLIVDPPWDYEWLSLAGRAKPGYATMSHEELVSLPVPAWAEDDAHLYLWVTNNFMTRGVDLMAKWGFQHKTVLTWVKHTKKGKPWFGLGSYFRNSTEHVLFGVRGDLRTHASNIPTHFTAKIGEHSEKPQEFYDIVRKASHGPFGEAFQRTARPDFANLYEVRDAAE